MGIVSALTVPRWLGPEEMGIFAVAILAITAINAFTESGFVSAFMQRKADYEQYIAPVRTINALRGFALGLLIYLAAPYIAELMNCPRATSVLKALALFPIVSGMTPMIWTIAAKRLLFAYYAKYNAFLTIVNLAITVPLAWHLKNVWALVTGMLVSSLIGLIISTFLSREGREFTFNLKPLKDLQSFSFWIFLTSIVYYLYINVGNWFIGSLLDVQILAVYTLAFKFTTMFTGEAASIINRMMLPVFSHIQDDLPRVRVGFRKSFGILAVVIVGVGSFFCVAAQDYFTIVLAEKWAVYTELFISLLPWLTLWGVCSAFAGAQSGVFQALGKPSRWMWSVVAKCVLMLLLVLPAVRFYDALGVAAVLGSVSVAMQFVRYFILSRMLQVSVLTIFSLVIAPAGAGIIAIAAATLSRGLITSNVWGQAVLANIVVVVTYIATLVAFSQFIYPNPLHLLKQARTYAMGKFKG